MNTKILIVGLPFFAEKYSYLLDSYNKLGLSVRFLINSNEKLSNDFSHVDYILASNNKFKRVLFYLKALFDYKPDFIDCYDYSILTFFYIISAKVFRIKTRIWLIGGELTFDFTHINDNSYLKKMIVKMKTSLLKVSLALCDTILAKEKHHEEEIFKINSLLLEKTRFLHNCVPVNAKYMDRDFKQLSAFIYANAVIESRHVDSLVISLSEVQKQRKFNATIYGFSSIANEVYSPRAMGYSEKVLSLYDSLDIKGCVSVRGFVKDIQSKYSDFKFFVLPADVIFANYALLEAMAIGVVPIVYPGDGFDKIVRDGLNGIVAYENDLASALIRALDMDEDDYLKMSKSAYETIKVNFSLETWESKLAETLS